MYRDLFPSVLASFYEYILLGHYTHGTNNNEITKILSVWLLLALKYLEEIYLIFTCADLSKCSIKL